MTAADIGTGAAGPEARGLVGDRSDPRISTFGLLHEAHRRLERTFDRSLATHSGMSGSFFEVLLRIGRSPGTRLTMSELACQLGLTSGGATRLVDRVVEAGLVVRTSCPSDRRVQWVVLTPAGEQKLDEGLSVHLDDLQRELIDRLDPDELEMLERALDKLRR
ncbi:MAG: MarR family winged helix-turn-helix transcriptional regulator [Acidimicrobiia bacterium]